MVEGATGQKNSAAPVDTIIEDAAKDGCTGPEDPDAVDRIKAPPVCVDSTLKKEAMSTETLQQWVFSVNAILPVCTTKTSMPGTNWSGSSMASTGTAATNTTTPPKTLAMTTDDPHDLPSSTNTTTRVPVSVVSVSSNNSCGDSHTLSSDEMTEVNATVSTVTHSSSMQPPTLDRAVSEHLNAKVSLRKTSRQGRLSQRWVNAPTTVGGNNSTRTTAHSPCVCDTSSAASAYPHEPIMMRLVTGCVPILRSGKILFISASRKPAWIVPKGGWEQDESMEESAVRECFEEAGCLGTLGPALSPVQHEARKAKKRRLDQDLFLEQQQMKSTTEARTPTAAVATLEEEAKPKTSTEDDTSTNPTATDDVADATPKEAESTKNGGPKEDYTESGATNGTAGSHPATSSAAVALSAEAMSRIRQCSQNSRSSGHHTDNETMSVGSTLSATYSHVQMTLFPLYVQKIEDDWPEKGRFRKAVDIDEAIAMLGNRPEMQAALKEVKERGLHLVPDAQEAAVPATANETTE